MTGKQVRTNYGRASVMGALPEPRLAAYRDPDTLVRNAIAAAAAAVLDNGGGHIARATAIAILESLLDYEVTPAAELLDAAIAREATP